MRLSSILIDGFGVFHDALLPDIPEGLVLIRGDNEAGKSTLLGFIRAILFGFSDKRSREPQYLPLDGGTHGGRLSIVMANGNKATIERGPGPHGGQVAVTGPDGILTDPDLLGQVLGNTSAELYKNIYAFSLSELQTFETLQTDSIKNAIYGAIVGAAALSLPDAMKNIDKQLADRFKPGGSNPAVNVLLGQLEQTRKDLRNATDGVAEFDAANARLHKTDERLVELKKDLVCANTQKGRAEKYIQLWPQWIDLLGLEKELEQLPPMPNSFPKHGLAKLDRLQDRLDSENQQLSEREGERDALRAEVDDLVIDDDLLARAEAVAILYDGRTACAKALLDLPQDVEQRKTLDAKIADLLIQLGNDWSERRALGVDRSMFTRESIAEYRDALAANGSALLRAEEKLNDAQEQFNTAQHEVTAAEEELQGLEIPADTADEEIIGALKTGRDDFGKAFHDQPGVESELNSTRERLDDSIKSISPQWTVDNVNNFDISIASRKKIEEFGTALDSAEQQVTES